jgi:hypothetical protein
MAVAATPTRLPVGERVTVHLPHVGALPATVHASAPGAITVVPAVLDERLARLAGCEAVLERLTPVGIQRYAGTLSVERLHDGLLTIALTGGAERVQRREWARVQAVLTVDVAPLHEEPVGGRTLSINVSAGGVLIKDPWRIPLGLDLHVAIELEPGVMIAGLGRAVREAGSQLKGIRLDDVAPGDRERLLRYVRERERAELRLSRGM